VLLSSLLLLLQLRADNERLRAAAAAGRGSAGGAVPGAAVEATGAALHRKVRDNCELVIIIVVLRNKHRVVDLVDAGLCDLWLRGEFTASISP
jgi:hypothetical protein